MAVATCRPASAFVGSPLATLVARQARQAKQATRCPLNVRATEEHGGEERLLEKVFSRRRMLAASAVSSFICSYHVFVHVPCVRVCADGK